MFMIKLILYDKRKSLTLIKATLCKDHHIDGVMSMLFFKDLPWLERKKQTKPIDMLFSHVHQALHDALSNRFLHFLFLLISL
ncbi:hypothetical protein Leryth_020580 [Lithospermum erythrorhizon]|nr:hypothetical protein Leryth_020580 [Lithospermum erythrorhizon]